MITDKKPINQRHQDDSCIDEFDLYTIDGRTGETTRHEKAVKIEASFIRVKSQKCEE